MSVVALVPAAGRGVRLGGSVPKALVPIRGEPLLVHAVRGLLASGCVHAAVVAAPASDVDVAAGALAAAGVDAQVVPGGPNRTQSVRLALHAAGDPTIVLVHDAARAFTPAEVIKAVVAAVSAGVPAVIPVLPVADTVKRVDPAGVVLNTPDRSELRIVQTPQGFSADVLRRAYDAYPDDTTTDDAGLVERLGVPVATVPGHAYAMKITTPFDLAIAESVLS
ncbi:MAG TPA: 2-C-methyl-D-erythritol 4-phosphate cytidylyltransferase [Actinophytocola sp.]|uniref:2-C-methyl-D-erythritol 4-phosphate cytidylyltransferase n=1 Tax=Actinophytocola sp. TaxID=1872138 RepID=UPI002DDCB31E|nr:2-C-methyl-D-erythritol 4-phosphate cytidylyltransferase [Actinophytocola sp.]HEV2783251.1 2-C-methyl-D-erythritol 4-phosphate cytidylyltransferase [Actinophytocola sp.]